MYDNQYETNRNCHRGSDEEGTENSPRRFSLEEALELFLEVGGTTFDKDKANDLDSRYRTVTMQLLTQHKSEETINYILKTEPKTLQKGPYVMR